MSYINVNLSEDIQEDQPVEEGNYTLTINTAEEKESKSGKPMIQITHVIDGEANAPLLYQFLSLPNEDDDPKIKKFKSLNIKRYLTLVGIDYESEGFDVDELVGQSFEAYVTKEEVEQEDPSAPPQFTNNIRVPRLAAEGNE